MECPKCSSKMEKVQFKSIEVDRCTGCRGIWFDLMEREDLVKLEGSETIDTGHSGIGQAQNEKDRYDCPSCASPMIRMVDNDQPHIWYEKCSSCYGSFLDAGEFRDLKDDTLIDIIQGLLVPTRK